MGKIQIKEQNRGKFTAWAQSHGMTVQQAAATILRNRSQYSAALIKRANFARNAAKWVDGGPFNPDFRVIHDKDFLMSNAPNFKKGGIHINPKNKGKFTATKKATGKTTEELTHSKNPKTRKRAIFAQNARKWHHGDGGLFEYVSGGVAAARKKPGGSNVGKKTFANGQKRTGPYVGPSGGAPKGSYPIPDEKHARAALALAHNAPNPAGIKAAVHRKYPNIGKKATGGMFDFVPSYAGGGLSSAKAKEILRDGTAQGHPLTAKQKRYFGWVAGGSLPKHGTGGDISSVGGMLSAIPTPFTKIAGGILGGIGGLIGGNEQEKERVRQERMVIDNAAEAGNASRVNPYASTFAFGGQFKGKKFGGPPNAEVEGGGRGRNGEVIITPDSLMTNIKGPTHAQGGVPVALPDKSLIISRQYAKEAIPLTAKVNKAKKILAGGGTMLTKNSATLNFNKYYAKALDIYGRQEVNKGLNGEYSQNEFQDGGPYGENVGYNADEYVNKDTEGIPTEATFGSGINQGYGINGGPNSKFISFNPSADVDPGENKSNWKDALNTVGELAPTLYNLGQGLFGKRDTVNANRYRNPYEGKINSLMANRRYDIGAPLQANEASYATARRNITNMGGPGARSNITGAMNQKMFADMALYGQQSNMNNQYAGEYANALYPLGRDTVTARMSADEANAMTNAAGRNMIGAGMTGVQRYLLTKQQMKNQLQRDKLLGNAMYASSPYARKWAPGVDEYLNGQ